MESVCPGRRSESFGRCHVCINVNSTFLYSLNRLLLKANKKQCLRYYKLFEVGSLSALNLMSFSQEKIWIKLPGRSSVQWATHACERERARIS